MNKLKQLPLHWQLLLLVGVAAGVYGAFWYFVTNDMRIATQGIVDQVTAQQQKNEAARIATQRIDEFRTLYTAKAAEYDELKVLLPEQREITNVLQGLQDTAQESRLTLLRFTPRDDSQQGFITAKAVEIEVSSNFNNLRNFYEKMARLPRIVSISDFKVNQLPKQTADKSINSQFLLTAYYASPEPPPSATKPTTPGATPTAPTTPGTTPATPPTTTAPTTPPAVK
ncbi:MAG: type 4a pilus biogenesis protein PilO [Pyrinomonadaceae bacterium]|nr:type 4a pilus biogenesis protein PilO [Pyrinomonadaceae bacterium]